MNSLKNLIPLNRRTKKEQRSIAKSGGIASGISRREKRQMKEILLYLLNCNTSEGISTKEAIGVALIKECLKGNMRAFETLMLMIGEQPQEKNIDIMTNEEMKKQAEIIRKKLFERGEAEPMTIVVANSHVKKMIEDV